MIALIKQIEDHILLQISGDVLMENSKDFYNSIADTLKVLKKTSKISIDFRKVHFMDSSGMGALIKLAGDFQKIGCNIIIFNLNKNLTAVFKLSGIHSIVKIKTLEDYLLEYPQFEYNKGISNE
jgi:stage II sporulation protein AA (anti-sigma F factor antagonist)